MINDHTADGAASLRTASGGGGSLLSASVSATATGTWRPNDSASTQVSSGGAVYMRRVGNRIGGEVVIFGVRV